MERADRINTTVAAIIARGQQPTSRAVLAEIDGRGYSPREFVNGMSGRDLEIFAEAMRKHGFMRVKSPGGRVRWERFA